MLYTLYHPETEPKTDEKGNIAMLTTRTMQLPLRRAYPTGHRDPVEAFESAIDSGRLSADRAAPNFAGAYMYMGTVAGIDQFKHIDTRRYLPQLGAAVAMLAPIVVHAHDMHGLTHDHASGIWFLGTWLVASVAIYIIDTLRGARK